MGSNPTPAARQAKFLAVAGVLASSRPEHGPNALPPETARSRWRLALTGAHLARKSEITPGSPKVRRELFEIVLQEQILLAAR